MNRRDFLGLAAAGLLEGAPARPPNIVFILSDDLGYGDLACQNAESKITTPHLDRLAAQGVRFTDAHSPSAVCTPTRYGVITGRYAWRSRLKSGVLEGYSPDLIEPGRPTVASLLRSRGYHTGAIGKWHLGLGDQEKTDFTRPLHPGPLDHGFDSFFGIPASLDMPPYLYVENDRVVEQATATTEGKNQSGVYWRGGAMAPSFQFDRVLATLAAKATAYLRERAARRGQPFFLYLALTGPHTPWAPRKEFLGRSKAGLYGDFVGEVDAVTGEVLATLDKTGLGRNTLVIFTSDNGPERFAYERVPEFGHYSMGRLRGVKRDAWEGGHRVPFLARWPGRIRPGTTSEETICLTDLVATAAALAGAKVPANAGEDSYNIAPALFGEKRAAPIREATVLHTANGEFAIRQGDWVFIDAKTGMNSPEPEWFRKERGYALHKFLGELYDLRQDLAERTNLYAERPEVVAKLKDLLEKYKREGRSAPS
jgi:arylsulfatase A-like enzyme